MPWVRAELRGKQVFARADANGSLVVESGGVEIRYKPNDGRKYAARAANLKVTPGPVLPEETCGPAEAVAKKEPGGRGASAAKRPGGRARPGGAAEAPSADAIIAYADGACSGNPGPAGSGVVLIAGGRVVERSDYLGVGTNNIGELTAIRVAVEEAEAIDAAEAGEERRPLHVFTDSQYSIGVLQKGWKAKANSTLVAAVKEAVARRDALLSYVPGHAGVALNERADALARQAVASRKSTRTESQTRSGPTAGTPTTSPLLGSGAAPPRTAGGESGPR